jgi:hypothetical protein
MAVICHERECSVPPAQFRSTPDKRRFRRGAECRLSANLRSEQLQRKYMLGSWIHALEAVGL